VDYGNGDVHQWSYDDIGNRVQQIVIPTGQPPIVTNYTYYQNGQGRNSQLLQSDGLSTYTWDNNGNLTAKGSTNYMWDYDDRLVGISGPSTNAYYVYDYQGNRLKKTVGGMETSYLYLSEDIVKDTSSGIVTNYLHGIGIDEPVMMDRAGTKSYYFSDGLGSIRELTDGLGTVQNFYTYGAWGELRAQNITLPNSYGYTGREFAEDELYFYRARYLDSRVGRFLKKDPKIDVGLKLSLKNKYPYVDNSPINYSDAFGLWRVSPD
jgi:RHS repeat-associated protein